MENYNLISQVLNEALKNGHTQVITMDSKDVANNLNLFYPQFKNSIPNNLIPHIEMWQKGKQKITIVLMDGNSEISPPKTVTVEEYMELNENTTDNLQWEPHCKLQKVLMLPGESVGEWILRIEKNHPEAAQLAETVAKELITFFGQ